MSWGFSWGLSWGASWGQVQTTITSKWTTYMASVRSAMVERDWITAYEQVQLAKTMLAELSDMQSDQTSSSYRNSLAILDAIVKDLITLRCGDVYRWTVEL